MSRLGGFVMGELIPKMECVEQALSGNGKTYREGGECTGFIVQVIFDTSLG
jgi:hypothetical protein